MEENAKVPFLKPALIYGAILGFVGIVLSVVLYFLNLSLQSWVQYLTLAITLAVMVCNLWPDIPDGSGHWGHFRYPGSDLHLYTLYRH